MVLHIIRNKRLQRYFFMAVCIVLLELASFQVLYALSNLYIFATIASFFLAVMLNWLFSRKFVFGASHHAPHKEFLLVLIASIVGVLIQISVVFIAVEVLLLYPLVGKILSIGFSFFWNYWFRAKLIFKPTSRNIDSETL